MRKIIFYDGGGKRQPLVVQTGGGCLVPEHIQGQGLGSEQPGLDEDVPSHCRGVGLDGY